jgi:hypothetical protein
VIEREEESGIERRNDFEKNDLKKSGFVLFSRDRENGEERTRFLTHAHSFNPLHVPKAQRFCFLFQFRFSHLPVLLTTPPCLPQIA